MPYIIAGIVILILLILLIRRKNKRRKNEEAQRTAGKQGEVRATKIISGALRKDDVLLTNVSISFDGKKTELDNVVVNKYGVFIIEVKSYKGVLHGKEDDYEWTKVKDDGYGNTFVKSARNPIPQVKRQVYILANFLKSSGVKVWVMGYVLFLYGNSPVKSEYVLENVSQIDHAVHTTDGTMLTLETIEKIKRKLK